MAVSRPAPVLRKITIYGWSTNPCAKYIYLSACIPPGTQLNSGTPSGKGNNRNWNMFGQICPFGEAMLICPSLASSGEGNESGRPAGGSGEQLPLFGRLISEVLSALKAAKDERDIFALLKEYRQMKVAFAAARLDLGSNTYIGTNLARSNPEIPGTVEEFVKHAEGDAFAQAIRTGIDYEGQSGTLYVTRAKGVGPCQVVCQRSFDAVARQMGLSDLTVYTPEGFFGSWDPVNGWVLAK